MKKNIFEAFENADSTAAEKLSGYIKSSDAAADRIFEKSVRKYAKMTQTSDSMNSRRNITCITNVTEKKRSGIALKIALSGVAAACAVTVGLAVVRPLLKAPETQNKGYSVQHKTVNGRELRTAVPPDKASKDDIFWLMMNSIFYYDKVSGTSYSAQRYDWAYKEEFQYCVSTDRSYIKSREKTANNYDLFKNEETISNYLKNDDYDDGVGLQYVQGKKRAKKGIDADAELKGYIDEEHESFSDIKPVSDSERIKYEKWSSGNNVLSEDTFYPDPTPDLGYYHLFNQREAVYYLLDQSSWYTDGIFDVNGRDCYHITWTSVGHEDHENPVTIEWNGESIEIPYYQNSNDEKIEMWVDCKTGIIIKQCNYDDGLLTGYIELENIRYEDEAEPVKSMPEEVKKQVDETEPYSGANDEAELYERISALTEELAEVDDEMERLNDLSEDEKRESMARLSEQRAALQEMLDELNANKEKLDELNEERNRLGKITPKEDIFSLMMNSIYHYDKVSGKYFVGSRTADKIDGAAGEVFSSDMNDSRAYSYTYGIDIPDDSSIEAIVKACKEQPILKEYDVSYAEDGIRVNILGDNDDDFGWNTTISKSDIKEVSPEERRKVSADGKSCEVIMYPDPTNAGLARESIFPQEYAVNRLSLFDVWENLGFEDVDDRECYHLSGKAGIGSNKIVLDENDEVETEDAVRFDMWVDVSTGIIVKYAEYDKHGKICRFMYTTELKFDDEAEPVKSMPDKTKKKAIENKNDPNSKFQDADLSNHAERRQQRRI